MNDRQGAGAPATVSAVEKVSVNEHMFYNVHDQEALTLTKIIADEAKANASSLPDYGISAADIAELDAAIDQVGKLINAPAGVIGERKLHIGSLKDSLLRCIYLIGIFLCVLVVSCNEGSENGNEGSENYLKKYNIYFLGNSITLHGPNEGIGWNGNWGMAASAEENDYVHKLIKKIEGEYEKKFRIKYGLKSIANWERDFFVGLQPLEINEIDLLIIRLGENVLEEYAMNNNYYDALNELIEKYKKNTTKIIITDNYWPSVFKDVIQKNVAINNGYFFVQINDLYGNQENSAFGQFENSGVAMHPSDIGMENIARRIFECIMENNIIN
jgi:hypothetical protein